jgi:hypothetical protein
MTVFESQVVDHEDARFGRVPETALAFRQSV